MYDWGRCDHSGIGQPGCPTCDPNKDRCMARAVSADNKYIRAENARLRAAIEWVCGEIGPQERGCREEALIAELRKRAGLK